MTSPSIAKQAARGPVLFHFLALRERHSRRIWSDRNAPFWPSCLRCNIKRVAGTVLSLTLYQALMKLDRNYLIANGVFVVLLTVANYFLCHWWTFVARGQRLPGIKLDEAPSVSG
jgi:hypothetical protein